MHARIAAAALGAAVLLAGCGGSGGSSSTTTAAPGTSSSTTTATTTTTTTTAGTGREIDLAVEGGKINGDGPPRVTLDQGDEVAIHVTSDVADEVHVHGYDLHADVAPGKPVTIRFTASVPGRFEAELESRGLQILQFTVEP